MSKVQIIEDCNADIKFLDNENNEKKSVKKNKKEIKKEPEPEVEE